MSADAQVLVIGAGVVGLAIAAEIAAHERQVLVLECNDRTGAETSARNSEVVHAGIYYPPGSLKARLCLSGKQLLYDYCEANGVAVRRCGKLLVATSEAEIPRLEALRANAAQNGVTDLQWLSAEQVSVIEPQVSCVAGCLSPSTGVVDSHGLMQSLAGRLQASHGEVVLQTKVVGIRRDRSLFKVEFESCGESGSLSCEQLVIAAGHGAPALGRGIGYSGDYQSPRGYFALGHYYRADTSIRVSHLVYPMPDGAWLGTHLTLDIDGGIKFGPDNQWIGGLDYEFDDSLERRQQFAREIQRYLPGIEAQQLRPDYTGIRPKIYTEGEPPPDFAIHGPRDHGLNNLVCLYGIESPGLTASLAIGEYVTGLLGVQ